MNYQVIQSNYAKAPLVVCFNGGGMGQWMWQNFIDAMKIGDKLSQVHLMTLDYTGFGQNRQPGTAFGSIHTQVETIHAQILELRSQLKLTGPTILIGHSIGAQLALYYANSSWANEAHIKGAIIISALNQPSQLLLKLTLPSLKWTMPLIKQRWFAWLQARSLGLPKPMFEAYFYDSTQISLDWLTQLMIANMTFKIESLVDESTILYHIAVGEKEPPMMIKSAQGLSPNAIVVHGASHDIPFSRPELIVQWLEETIHFCR